MLMDAARAGQRRPGALESADLIKSAMWMRVRPGAPRSAGTVFAAVRLMYVSAALELLALELLALLTVLRTLPSLKTAILERNPQFSAAQWHAVVRAHVLPLEIGAPIAAGLLLYLAWANGRGRNWGRIAFVALFALNTVSLLASVAQNSATYAPVDLGVGVVIWLVALATVILICNGRSRSYYARRLADV